MKSEPNQVPVRGRLFVFSGIDGGGKSTQINQLAQRLRQSNHRPIILWARGGYTSGMNLAKTLLRLGSQRQLIPASGHSEQRTRAFSNTLVRRLWLKLSILDLLRVYAISVRWHLFRGRTVLCDRYWQDTLLDFQHNFPQETVESWWLWRGLERLSPRPVASFMLLVPTDVSKQRSIEKQEPYPTPEDVLKFRLATYRSWVANDGTWHVIDGGHSLEHVAAQIAMIVDSYCPALFHSQPADLAR